MYLKKIELKFKLSIYSLLISFLFLPYFTIQLNVKFYCKFYIVFIIIIMDSTTNADGNS